MAKLWKNRVEAITARAAAQRERGAPPSLDPMLDRMTIFARLNSAIPFFDILLKLLHCLTLVVIPIADVFPSFLERLPHPEVFEGREVRVGEHV